MCVCDFSVICPYLRIFSTTRPPAGPLRRPEPREYESREAPNELPAADHTTYHTNLLRANRFPLWGTQTLIPWRPRTHLYIASIPIDTGQIGGTGIRAIVESRKQEGKYSSFNIFSVTWTAQAAEVSHQTQSESVVEHSGQVRRDFVVVSMLDSRRRVGRTGDWFLQEREYGDTPVSARTSCGLRSFLRHFDLITLRSRYQDWLVHQKSARSEDVCYCDIQ